MIHQIMVFEARCDGCGTVYQENFNDAIFNSISDADEIIVDSDWKTFEDSDLCYCPECAKTAPVQQTTPAVQNEIEK